MASVTSLDQDMRNLRLGRYTPQAANETRQWIEESLGRSIPPGDLLDALKDGTALCELANKVLPTPGIKFKKSGMPFIQMENISHFLRACEMPPLNMPAHDRFLTVDLFESKDPAQVLQCLGAFSRQAHAVKPTVFRSTIGPKKAANPLSPNGTGSGMNGRSSMYGAPTSQTRGSGAMRPMSPARTGGSTGSGSGSVSSWSKKTDEGATSPAWNVAQYGYMGGASQGNQGISFGARRQITSQGPTVPSLAEKERVRKEKAAEGERVRKQTEQADIDRRAEREAEEERERLQEERRWEDETQRQREAERQHVEEQKRQWAEQERKWKQEEEVRRKEDADSKRLMTKKPPEKPRVASSTILRGQTLSQHQRESVAASTGSDGQNETPEQARVRELEHQLEEARERERHYQMEREERLTQSSNSSRLSTAQTQRPDSAKESEASWAPDERESLRKQWQANQPTTPAKPAQSGAPREQKTKAPLPSLTSRPLPQPMPEVNGPPDEEESELPTALTRPTQQLNSNLSSSSVPRYNPDSAPSSSPLGSTNRPLPTPQPKAYDPFTPQPTTQTRTSAFLSSNPAPSTPQPRISSATETGDTALEQSTLNDRRQASQKSTQAGGWASKSLLEREMERERERQREWETEQKRVAERKRDPNEGVGEGQTWDVNQYGFTGGDGMNRGSSSGSGIAIGGRRQIIGPRPQK
nr:hypothetical protein B0A51_13173 [Rachicladosporium sp. CCFEE 5018]